MKVFIYNLIFFSSLNGMVLDLDNPNLAEELQKVERIIAVIEKGLDEFKNIHDLTEAEKKFSEILIEYDHMNESPLWSLNKERKQ